MVDFTELEAVAAYIALDEYLKYLTQLISDPDYPKSEIPDLKKATDIARSAQSKLESVMDPSRLGDAHPL